MSDVLSNEKNEWETKVEALSYKSKEFKSLSCESRLELINAMISSAKESLRDDSIAENDMAVLKLLSLDGQSAKSSSSLVKSLIGFNKYGTISIIMNNLWNIKKKLQYELALKNGKSEKKVNKPLLLKRVKEEIVNGKNLMIHGPVEIFPLFHKFEVWADSTSNPSLGQNSMQQMETENNDGVCVLLGAGNQSFIVLIDVLHCLFNRPSALPVLIKHHPLRPYMYSVISKLFAPLIDAGFLDQVLDGGIAETSSILQHAAVKHVHLTGALTTSQSIERALASSRPDCTKEEIESMITSELGCATPWIICPGKYSKRELRMAAKHIATAKKVNAGCNCLSAQVVVLPKAWKQKEEFREILVTMLCKIPTSPLYYPGSKNKVEEIVSHYSDNSAESILQPQSRRVVRDTAIGNDEEDYLQPFIVNCGTYGDKDYNDYALKKEAFGPLLAIVELPGSTGDEYLNDIAVPFVNNKNNIYGSLSCSIVFPRKYSTDIVRAATASLNYSCVTQNSWSLYGYFSIAFGGIWGGSILDLTGQSGRGHIGNIFSITNGVKTVVSSRSLTFPLIYDKMLMPPKFMLDIVSSIYILKNPFRSSLRKDKKKKE